MAIDECLRFVGVVERWGVGCLVWSWAEVDFDKETGERLGRTELEVKEGVTVSGEYISVCVPLTVM